MTLWTRLTTRNVGRWDRVLRTLPSLVVLALWQTGTLGGLALGLAAVVAAMLLLTAVTGMCSIYAMLGISTCPAARS